MNGTTRRRFLPTGAASLALPIRFAQAATKGGVMRMGKAHGQAVDSLDPPTRENGFTIRPNVWNKKPFRACYRGGRPTADRMRATACETGVPWNDAAWEHEKFNGERAMWPEGLRRWRSRAPCARGTT